MRPAGRSRRLAAHGFALILTPKAPDAERSPKDRLDKERTEKDAFEPPKAELTQVFAAPEEGYVALTEGEVIGRNGG